MHSFRQALATPHPGRRRNGSGAATGASMKTSLAVALLSAVALAGCAANVHVAQLKDQPTKYATKTVSVQGVVTNSWGIPLLPLQLYSVDDGSGEITVVSQSGRVPAKG